VRGEQKKISDIDILVEFEKEVMGELREKHPGIPWKDIAGMRDKLSL